MTKKDNREHEEMMAEMLLKDADEAIRQEKLNALWTEWGSTVIGVALMIVFGTMVGVGWQNWRNNVHTAQTAALLEQKTDVLEGSYKGVAGLLNAETAARNNNPATLYNLTAQAADSGLPREWDILAKWASLRTKADLEDDKAIDIANDMVKLAKKGDNPYVPAIQMEAAILYGQNGDVEKALELLASAQENPMTVQNATLSQDSARLITFYKQESK